ncbi:MAG: OmpA family protein [Proteobacteria bacterium]|nr:OmpA family protein [Pseudomonadota bacterium]
MEFSAGGLIGKLARLGAVVAIAATLGACSVIPSWMGGDSGSSSATEDTADASAPPADQSAAPAADSTTASANNGQFPDLADTPDRPAAPSTADDQKRVADSLAADRARQNYSADALRAGTETAAAPPGAAPPPDEVADVDTGSKSADASDANASAAPAPDTSADSSSNSTPAAADTAATPAPAPTTAVASTQAPPPAAAPSNGLPAVPANSSINGAQSVAMSDAALGFQASKAPPLDASVAQFVPMPIISRYQQTASLGGAAGVSGSPYAGGGPAVPAVPNRAMGGPERMTGAVVANYDALQGGAVAPAAVYSNAQGLPPAAVIAFSDATTILSADAKAQVRSAAETFNARGATGYIRVVGHASSATSKVSEARRLQINFERSQARATSVMRELIKDGVPANKILIDAVGDSQPVYDAAAQGENGNRRAEIFFQG